MAGRRRAASSDGPEAGVPSENAVIVVDGGAAAVAATILRDVTAAAAVTAESTSFVEGRDAVRVFFATRSCSHDRFAPGTRF